MGRRKDVSEGIESYSLLKLVETVEVNAESVHHVGGRLVLGGRHGLPHKVVRPSLAAEGVQLRLFQLAS